MSHVQCRAGVVCFAAWLASFFYSYIIEKNRPTDPAVVERMKAAIKGAADKEIGILAGNAYPVARR